MGKRGLQYVINDSWEAGAQNWTDNLIAEFTKRRGYDPRPWLLIAHSYAQLGWVSNSVERYQRAYRADPTCRGDPQMLEDLLNAVTHRVAGRDAARAIRDMYGAEALPALEKAIARGAGEGDGNDRLDHLRDSLAQ